MNQRNAEADRGVIVPPNWNGRVPPAIPDEWNAVTERIIRAAMEVHTALGPSLLERLYEQAMLYELHGAGLRVRQQVPGAIKYKEIRLEGQRVDLIVNNLVIVELKAVEAVSDIHLAQLSYQRSADMPLGLLINFKVMRLKDGLYRRICPQSVVTRLSAPADEPAIPSSGSPPRSSGFL